MRIDVYLVQQGLCITRTKAQDAIKEGRVFVDGKNILKNSFAIDETMQVELQDTQLSFASRAGFKLFDVLYAFQIQLTHRICIDVGASTGGFSDVCLRAGASLVYAVDVGKDQLIPYLKEHPKIRNMESINCRYLTNAMFDPLPDFACMDVSFISIKLILPVLIQEFDGIEIVALIKPQFEAGKSNIGKHGIIKNEKVHIQVLQDMIHFVESLGYYVHHIQASSILGRDGNKEFVMHIKKTPLHKVFPIKEIVKKYNVKR